MKVIGNSPSILKVLIPMDWEKVQFTFMDQGYHKNRPTIVYKHMVTNYPQNISKQTTLKLVIFQNIQIKETSFLCGCFCQLEHTMIYQDINPT